MVGPRADQEVLDHVNTGNASASSQHRCVYYALVRLHGNPNMVFSKFFQEIGKEYANLISSVLGAEESFFEFQGGG